jgi:hypothetical protein
VLFELAPAIEPTQNVSAIIILLHAALVPAPRIAGVSGVNVSANTENYRFAPGTHRSEQAPIANKEDMTSKPASA